MMTAISSSKAVTLAEYIGCRFQGSPPSGFGELNSKGGYPILVALIEGEVIPSIVIPWLTVIVFRLAIAGNGICGIAACREFVNAGLVDLWFGVPRDDAALDTGEAQDGQDESVITTWRKN